MTTTFPQGVCDYTKPGVDRVPTAPWQTYQGVDGKVIYGGRGLGDAPVSVPFHPCGSRRSITVTVPKRGHRLRSARVYVDGKRVRVKRGRRHMTARINLRGRARGTVHVRIVAVTRSGRRIVTKRHFRTCTPRARRT